MDRQLFTVRETQDITQIKRSKLYELISAGVLPSVKIGRSRRIARLDLENFIERLRAGDLPDLRS